jgi:hypothetical protein
MRLRAVNNRQGAVKGEIIPSEPSQMKTFPLVIPALFLFACGGTDDKSDNFIGTYKTTLTLGSSTFTDTLGISDGETADLIMSSAQLGTIKATIIGGTSFSIDQQQITVTDSTGHAVSLTMQGQGTVNDGVLAASGQLSSSSGALSLNMNGSRQ